MTLREYIEFLKQIPCQEGEVILGFDNNLGKTRPIGRYEIKKYEDGYIEVFLLNED